MKILAVTEKVIQLFFKFWLILCLHRVTCSGAALRVFFGDGQ